MVKLELPTVDSFYKEMESRKMKDARAIQQYKVSGDITLDEVILTAYDFRNNVLLYFKKLVWREITVFIGSKKDELDKMHRDFVDSMMKEFEQHKVKIKEGMYEE